jgi:Cu+-exporting ATPase
MATHDHNHSTGDANLTASPQAADAVVRDPVCGMTVDPIAAGSVVEHGGQTYHFCSASCHDKFVKTPKDYLTAVDPVCGMSVDRATAAHFTRHKCKGFHFCSDGCKAPKNSEAHRQGRV